MSGRGVWEAKGRPEETHLACAEEANLDKTTYSTALQLKRTQEITVRRELFFLRTRKGPKLGLISIEMSWPRTIVAIMLRPSSTIFSPCLEAILWPSWGPSLALDIRRVTLSMGVPWCSVTLRLRKPK